MMKRPSDKSQRCRVKVLQSNDWKCLRFQQSNPTPLDVNYSSFAGIPIFQHLNSRHDLLQRMYLR
ncbi:unnamed protein product [Gadus morhua 'NCC']